MSHDIVLFLAAAVIAALLVGWRRVRRQSSGPGAHAARDALDTVLAWPPEATRVLTGAERKAYQMLVQALPGHMVLAQVPLSRFVKVPRRHSYAQWMSRVGQLSADLLVCDPNSHVLAAIVLRAVNASPRSQKRRERMARVLKAAGVKMLVWPEDAVPSPSAAREQLLPKTEAAAVPAAEPVSVSPALRALQEEIPVPEVVDDDGRQEPPPSTWFDDLDPLPAGGGWKSFERN